MIISSVVMLTDKVPVTMPNDKDNTEINHVQEMYRFFSIMFSGLYFYLLFPFGRRIFKSFALFERGMTEVFKRLFGFGVYVVIIITSYALMFFTVFKKYSENDCGEFCGFWSSWFQVYIMMLGNYGSAPIFDIQQMLFVYFFYILFGAIVIVMLLNVLIPIVWDAYNNVKNTKSANILFWEIRLELAIQAMLNSDQDNWLGSKWTSLTKKFEDKTADSPGEYFKTGVFHWFLWPLCRSILYLEIMVIWLLVGLFTAGALWPPQVRENIWKKWISARVFFSSRMSMPSHWSFLTKIYEDKSYDAFFNTRASRWILLPLCRLIFPLIIPIWLTLGLITFGLLWPPLNTGSFSIAEIWAWRSSKLSKYNASATNQNIQELEQMIKKLDEIRGERETAELGDNKKEMIIKINELIGRASALHAVVCSQDI